jgi:hypothetical protein
MSGRVRSYSSPSATVSEIASTTARAPEIPSFFVDANGESLARWQTSLASRRPIPAIDRWSRRNP